MIPFDDEFSRYAEACRSNLTHDRMVELAGDPIPFVRFGIAWNGAAASDVLMILAEDESDGVRNRVAENPNTPPLVKLYLQSGGYQGMTLKEFLEAAGDNHESDISPAT